MIKQATKTCNLFRNNAATRVEKRCCAFYHPRSILFDWIKLPGSDAVHGGYVTCCKTSLPWAGKTCNKYTSCCPPKFFCIKIVFNFSWNDCNTQEKLKAKVMQYSGGKQGVRIMGDVQMDNWSKRNKVRLNEVNNPLSSFLVPKLGPWKRGFVQWSGQKRSDSGFW